MDVSHELVQRSMRYVAITSQSDSASSALPSSPGQLELARLLARELQEIGLSDVIVDAQAIVTGVRREHPPHVPRIGFIAHLDTADVGLSPMVRPQIHRFTGQDICMNSEEGIWLRVDEHPEICEWRDHDIITGDGTSVLGADNKAAIAIIMTLLNQLDNPRAMATYS